MESTALNVRSKSKFMSCVNYLQSQYSVQALLITVTKTESICVLTRTYRNILPDWIAGAEGKALQKRVWQDLVKRLEYKGHGIFVVGNE